MNPHKVDHCPRFYWPAGNPNWSPSGTFKNLWTFEDLCLWLCLSYDCLCVHKVNMRESGFSTWKAVLAAWVWASHLSKRMWSWRWTPVTSEKCFPVSSVMGGNILVSVLYDVYDPCALYFRETEANNGVHVWEASHQRRHDHGHQTGETYGSHE